MTESDELLEELHALSKQVADKENKLTVDRELLKAYLAEHGVNDEFTPEQLDAMAREIEADVASKMSEAVALMNTLKAELEKAGV